MSIYRENEKLWKLNPRRGWAVAGEARGVYLFYVENLKCLRAYQCQKFRNLPQYISKISNIERRCLRDHQAAIALRCGALRNVKNRYALRRVESSTPRGRRRTWRGSENHMKLFVLSNLERRWEAAAWERVLVARKSISRASLRLYYSIIAPAIINVTADRRW